MNKHQLAQELRQRQYNTGLIPRRIIDELPDDEIIDCYNTCSHCGKKQVTDQNLEIAIAQAQNAYHFLELCDQLADSRYKETHATEQRLAPVHPKARNPYKRRRGGWVEERGQIKAYRPRRVRE